MEIETQYYFAGCNGKPAGYCQYTETIGDIHCFVMEDGSSVALGQEDIHNIVTMDQFHQMTLDEIQAMSRAISSICSACCKPHDTGRCSIIGSQVLCPDCMGDHLVDVARMALPAPQHTPEPWHLSPHITAIQIMDSRNLIVSVLINSHNAEVEANAQRIVECVNAFQHVQNPAQHLARLRANLETYSDELRRVRAERDALFEALKFEVGRDKAQYVIEGARQRATKSKGGQS